MSSGTYTCFAEMAEGQEQGLQRIHFHGLDEVIFLAETQVCCVLAKELRTQTINILA